MEDGPPRVKLESGSEAWGVTWKIVERIARASHGLTSEVSINRNLHLQIETESVVQ